MKWKTHQALAVTSFSLLNAINYSLESIIGLVVIIATSTMPDIDYKLGMRHRAFTHSLLALAIVSLTGYAIYKPLLLPIIIGYGSHLLADSFTKTGEMLLYPVKKMYGFKWISTGSSTEMFILLICIGYLFTKYW